MRCIVAVMDAGEVLGREVVQVLDDLEDSGWVTELRLFGTLADTTARFRGKDLPIKPYHADLMKGVHLAIGGGERELEAGATVVAPASEDGDAPLVLCEIDPAAAADNDGLVTVPDGITAALALITRAFGDDVARVTGTALLPAGTLGPPALEELYNQTFALFSQEPLPERVIGGRLAFNVLPVERRFTGLSRLVAAPVSVQPLLVPVFGGTTFVLDVWTHSPMSAVDAAARLGRAPGLDVGDSAEPADLVGQGFVRVTPPVSTDPIRVLAAVDEVRRGATALVDVAREIATAPGSAGRR